MPSPMHELGIMESAINTVLEQASLLEAKKVIRIVLRIGSLAGVEPDSLRFAFDVVTRSTIAEGALLEICDVPARAYCRSCKEEFGVDSGFIFTCPTCGELSGQLHQGKELELKQIEMA